jgi:hypothetical protein
LVCNPTPEGVKLNKAQTLVETFVAEKPVSRRKAESLL